MRDLPRQDTQPERHAHLMLCMFKPFFSTDDLRSPDESSWVVAMQRAEQSNQWDARSTTMRLNIKGMLRQRHAADEEMVRRAEEARANAAAGRGGAFSDDEGEIINAACDEDDAEGSNVMPPTRNAHNVLAYVNNATDNCIRAGFSKSNDARLPAGALLSGRSAEQAATDANSVNIGVSAADAKSSLKTQAGLLTALDKGNATSSPPQPDPTPSSSRFNSAELNPYLVDLRTKYQAGLSEDVKAKMNARRDRTNEAVAGTDVGRASHQQHEAVRRIADEFGLNRKQRLAFFIFGAAWIARTATPTSEALRLHVSGGAGSGKSYVLKAIKALIDCPALKSAVLPGRLLTVAFQGKQACSVGGCTVHSVIKVPRRDKNKSRSTLDSTSDQDSLPPEKVARWLGVGAMAIEEISMVSCELLGKLQLAAAEVRPSCASLPFAGLICVTFGDLNQVRHHDGLLRHN